MDNRQEMLTLAEWEERKAFAGFGKADETNLKALRPIAEKYATAVVEELYGMFMSNPEAAAYFPDETTLERVKSLQKTYFMGLTGGDYGEKYLKDRLHIGKVHHRIGLPPRMYMGAYAFYLQSITPRILAGFPKSKGKGEAALCSLIKLINLDMELAIYTYSAAREDVIAQQAQEILEVSTPVLQVWKGIVVAPLIGSLDSRRTQMFMERLLERIVETNSPVALVDITGVPAIDTQTAQHIIETINAVNLLGAQTVLTGVRPAIAQTLVHLGIDLGEVVTRSSLSGGLAYAFNAVGLRVSRQPNEAN